MADENISRTSRRKHDTAVKKLSAAMKIATYLLGLFECYTSSDNCCYSIDDTLQLIVSKAKDLITFNVNKGDAFDRFKSIYGYETGRACFSPQGSGDGSVYVVDVESGTETLLEVQPQTLRINGISSFRVDDQDYMVSGCEDRSFKILDTNTGHMTSPQRVSATTATTIPGTNRAYVALRDQGAFVRILRWM